MEVKEVVLLFMFSLMTSALALFVQHCMKPNMILRRYYLWLTWHWIKNWKRQHRYKRKLFLLQPLGLCIYCNATWIGVVVFIYIFNFDLIKLFLFLGLVFFWIKTFLK